MLKIGFLGPLEVWVDGAPVDLGGGRHRAVLALLAIHVGRVVSSDRLVEELWGSSPPQSAAKSLQNHVSRLRALLGPRAGTLLVTRPPGYLLAIDADAVDAFRFERIVGSARGAVEVDPQTAVAELREALALWRGEALAEFAYEPFAQTEAARLEELRLSATEERIECDLAIGLDGALVPELRGLVALHPSRERLLGQLMLALYRSGRQADALEAYRAGRAALDRHLGLEPGPTLRALEQAILAHDSALGTVAWLPPAPGRRRRFVVPAVAAAAIVAISAVAWTLTRDEPSPVVTPNSVVRIDVRTNEVVDVIRVGREPGQIEVLGDHVFVTGERDGTLHRIDMRTGEMVTSGAFAASGQLTSAGAFLWVTSARRNEIVKVEPGSLIRYDAIPLEPDRLHAFVAAGAGSLWVSQYPSPAVLRWRLRTQTLQRRYNLEPSEFPVEVTYASGAAWVGLGSGELLRIDGRTGATRRITVGEGASDPVFGFGSIWSGSVEQPSVWRVDAVTERVTAVVPVGRVSFGLGVGAGSVWVANHCDGTVSRIDPGQNREVATVSTGHFPRWLAVGAGSVWVGIGASELSGMGCEARPS